MPFGATCREPFWGKLRKESNETSFWDGIVIFIQVTSDLVWKALKINKCYPETIAEWKIRGTFHQNECKF